MSDVVVIVDVLSFTTAVDVALGRGAVVLPYRWHDGREGDHAAEHNAVVAGQGPAVGWTLSPTTLTDVSSGTRLVLPSPNGSALSFGAAEAGAGVVLAGCLRNATAVGRAACSLAGPGGVVSVIAAGERWNGHNGPLRPALEDLLGAGAIVAGIHPGIGRSPEARMAAAAFESAKDEGLAALLRACGSGVEKAAKGQSTDVDLAAAHDVSAVVPRLDGVTFVDHGTPT